MTDDGAGAAGFEGRVGFVGLGNIGQPMALALVEAGFEVTVLDVREEATRPCAEAGARVASSPREVAESCELVAVAVVDDAQVESVVAGEDGVLAAARPGGLVVLHSTLLPATVLSLSQRCAGAGVGVVDAPVSGGDAAAREGALTVMVGGDEADIERCRPLFDAIGEHTLVMGPVGAGAATKLAQQLMIYCNQLAALEAMRLAGAHGIDEERLARLAQLSTADSWVIRNWGFFDRLMREHPQAGSDELYRFFSKDLFDVVVTAREDGLSLPLAGVASQLVRPAFQQRARQLGI
ncbi:MAG: NAD(P)-dependent oxidoreductase [Actinomycetota bacterium]|nr:NAD(P)-dependent oxidoreductase [Actinomycetota bacterium]